jgi:hypothetical protein
MVHAPLRARTLNLSEKSRGSRQGFCLNNPYLSFPETDLAFNGQSCKSPGNVRAMAVEQLINKCSEAWRDIDPALAPEAGAKAVHNLQSAWGVHETNRIHTLKGELAKLDRGGFQSPPLRRRRPPGGNPRCRSRSKQYPRRGDSSSSPTREESRLRSRSPRRDSSSSAERPRRADPPRMTKASVLPEYTQLFPVQPLTPEELREMCCVVNSVEAGALIMGTLSYHTVVEQFLQRKERLREVARVRGEILACEAKKRSLNLQLKVTWEKYQSQCRQDEEDIEQLALRWPSRSRSRSPTRSQPVQPRRSVRLQAANQVVLRRSPSPPAPSPPWPPAPVRRLRRQSGKPKRLWPATQ